ncbi:hypothetical protein B0H10DRAFT_1944623 [Mycena sp. CBHHK59/15]|nr:hypothetical protein B0H10DRAFT_1944623 [Mycena sp. CBHHK59/15]
MVEHLEILTIDEGFRSNPEGINPGELGQRLGPNRDGLSDQPSFIMTGHPRRFLLTGSEWKARTYEDFGVESDLRGSYQQASAIPSGRNQLGILRGLERAWLQLARFQKDKTERMRDEDRAQS